VQISGKECISLGVLPSCISRASILNDSTLSWYILNDHVSQKDLNNSSLRETAYLSLLFEKSLFIRSRRSKKSLCRRSRLVDIFSCRFCSTSKSEVNADDHDNLVRRTLSIQS
jgi:hypothetical protein